MEAIMQNPGLVHLAEEIFDYVGNADLLKIMEVSKTCYAFVNQYERNRLAKKLNSILARKDYYLAKKQKKAKAMDEVGPDPQDAHCTLFERFPNWEKICNFVKTNGTLPELNHFVTEMDGLGRQKRQHPSHPSLQKYNPLKIMMLWGKSGFVKVLLKCPHVNFPDALVQFCHYDDCYYPYQFGDHKSQCKVIDTILSNTELTRIDINAKKYTKQKQTVFHRMVLRGHPDIFKFIIDNVERYNIDIYTKDAKGKNAFEALIDSGDSRMMEKLNAWLKFPEFFHPDMFKGMTRNCLKTTLLDIFKEVHVNATKRPQNMQMRFYDELELLQERIWSYFNAKIAPANESTDDTEENVDEPPCKKQKQ